jgi:hypothetical protein
VLAFAPEQVWPGLERNGLAMELSNSFLIVAQASSAGPQPGPVPLAWHYSAERRADWCKLTTFEAVGDTVQVRHHRLSPTAPATVSEGGLHNQLQLGQAQPYIAGPTLASAISAAVLNGPWGLSDLARALQPYVDFIHQRLGLPAGSRFNPHQEVPGQWLDALPQNAVLDAQGQPQLIDEEWRSDSPITFGFLLFRAMQACALNVSRVAPCTDRTVHTPAQLIEAAFVALGHSLPEAALRSCVEQEAAIQGLIGEAPVDATQHLVFLQSHRFAERHLSPHAQCLEQNALAQQAVINDREHTIQVITGSRWWRWGRSVRWLMRLMKT